MSNVNEPIRFGDVVKLQTKSAFVATSTPACLGFLELSGKAAAQLLVVPPVKEDVKNRFQDAEFIITPVRGEKQQSIGTPLNYQTPFVLRTSDGKDGSTYTLNNKVQGHRDAIGLQLGATKGEMFMQVEKEGSTNATSLRYRDDGLSVRVVDSNRIRKTLNHLLTHVAKPKSDIPGGAVTCGGKGSALTFSFQRVVDAEGKSLTETHKYIKNPMARRSSVDALSPSKMDELGRADRVDSSELSDVDAMSRSSSIATLSSNPASPRAGSITKMTPPVDATAVAARLSTKDVESGNETEPTVSSSATSTTESPATPPKNAVAGAKSAETTAPATTPATPPKNVVVGAKTPVPAAAAPSPVKPEPATAESAKRAWKTEPTKPMAKQAQPVTPPAAVPREPIVVPADASTFPPAPAIYGPAPAPIVVSPKASTSPKTNKKPSTPTAKTPVVTKKPNSAEVAKLKAEAEVENVKPACAAECSVM